MDLIFTLLSFAAVAGIAVFISLRFNITSALTPFISTCFATMFLALFGCFGLIKLGGYLYFLLALAAVLYVALGYKNNWKALSKIITPGFVFFTAASVFVIVLFSIKQPMFIVWDEFSFWGTSIKLVKLNSELYTTAELGWAASPTQKPVLVMNGYLYEFFGRYQEWRAIAGMDVLLFSTVSALTAKFDFKKFSKAVPFLVIAFLTPFAFALYNTIYTPSYIYMSVMADVPMGMFFGAVFSMYFLLENKEKNLPAICLVIAALSYVKDTALPLSMIAATIICFDILFVQKEWNFLKLKKWAGKIVASLFVFITPVVFFVAWTLYLELMVNVTVVGNMGGSEQMSMAGMLIEGVKQLLGIGTTEKFAQIMGLMVSNYFNVPLTVLGSGLRLTIVILGFVAVAFFTTTDKSHKLRCVLYAFLSTAGFVAYYVFIGFCYVFIFSGAEATGLASYERYIYPYYIGWFIGALALVACSISQKQQKFFGLARAGIYATVLLMCLRLSNILLVSFTFIDFDEGFLSYRREEIAKSESIVEYIGESDQSIFFIGQGDDGARWYRYLSQVLPLHLDNSFGGGTICLPDIEIPDDSPYYIRISQQELLDYLKENNCGYIFVEQSDEYLEEGFGEMFSDGLEICEDGQSALYKINGDKFELIGEVE